MSYILDALTESERARRQGAEAPKYSLLPIAGGETSRRHVWPYVLAAGLLINAVVVYVRLQPGPPVDAPVADSAKAPPAPAAPKVKEATAAPSAAPIPAAKSDAVMSPAPRAAVPLPAPPARAGDPAATHTGGVRGSSARPAVAQAPGEGMRTPAQTPDAGKRPAAETAIATRAPSASAEKLSQRKSAAELAGPAAAARNTLPAVSVSGFIHEEGSSGFAIINDKLVREGDEIAPGLILEKILGNGVELSYKGQRFTR